MRESCIRDIAVILKSFLYFEGYGYNIARQNSILDGAINENGGAANTQRGAAKTHGNGTVQNDPE